MSGDVRSLDSAVRAAQRHGVRVTSASVDGDAGAAATPPLPEVPMAGASARWPTVVAWLGCALAIGLFALLFVPRFGSGAGQANAEESAPAAPAPAARPVLPRPVEAVVRRQVEQEEAWVVGKPHPEQPHLVAAKSRGVWDPEPGYVLENPVTLRVKWAPGQRHPNFSHISAAENEGYWTGDPGYTFPKKGDLTVVWTPGRGHPKLAHLQAGAKEGDWTPEPGYAFVNADPSDPAVAWAPGRRHPSHPNITSAPAQDRWLADPGYRFRATDSLDVAWVPGSVHPEHPNVVAGANEGKWAPASGYKWVNDTNGDMRVVRAANPNYERAAEKALEAMVCDWVKQVADASNQGGLVEELLVALVREAAIRARQDALVAAIRFAFPEASRSIVVSSASLLGDAADGRLNVHSWRASSVRDEVVARLRSADRDAADACQLAEWLCHVCERFDRR